MKEHDTLGCFLPTLVCLLLLSLPRMGVSGDCFRVDEDCQLPNHGSTLRFTDPNPQLEISVMKGRFLTPSMSCEAEGFNRIEWLKDGRLTFPFDFQYGSSKCHLSLLNCNQTVQITNTQVDAIGNYTCLVSNDEQTIQRTFQVYAEDPPFTEDPYMVGHDNCSDNAVKYGEDVYIFCEFCSGDKAQVTEVQWHRVDRDGHLVPIAQLAAKDASRYLESSNIYTTDCLETYNHPAAVGRKLIIRDVSSDSLGSYVLTAKYTLNGTIKASSEKITVSRAPDMIIEITVGVVVSLAVIFLVVSVVTMICYHHHLTLQLYWKNRFGKIEEHDGMEFDAFISFSDSPDDMRFAIAIAGLLLQQSYNVWMRDMHAIPGEALIAEEIVSMKRSRRCILVISPEYPTSSHSQVLTDLAADQTLRKRSRIIPILYRDVSKEHLKQHRRLAEIVRVCPCITWKEKGDISSTEIPDDHVNGWGSTEVPRDNVNECISEVTPSSNITGSSMGEIPSNNISGCCTGLVPMDSNQPSSDDGGGCVNVGNDQSSRRASGGSSREHDKNKPTGTNVDEVALCNSDIEVTPQDDDRNQLIEDQEEQEKKKKMKKQREKYEKRLLLKMPPKRLVASPSGATSSAVV